jgi:MerR family transcriptional regulator, heat shock protein HspR
MEKFYSIGKAAQTTGLSPSTIRLYEQEKLIIPLKTAGGSRRYNDLDIQRIACIHAMIVQHGLNFEGIRRLAALIPCWAIKNCDEIHTAKCDAFNSKDAPCWSFKEYPEAIQCRECIVYTEYAHCESLKDLLHKFIAK